MHTRSKRILWLLLALGLSWLTPEALAWSWNQPRPYNGFQSYSPGYGAPGYGYRPVYPKIYRRAYQPYYYGYGYRHHLRWPRHGYYRYFPGYRYYPGCRY